MRSSIRIRRGSTVAAAAAAVAGTVSAATFDFQSPSGTAGPHAIVAEPGAPSNRVLRIEADRLHHSRWVVPGSIPADSFVLETRVRCAAWTGAPPAIWLYALQPGGFVYGRWSGDRLRTGRWTAKASGENAASDGSAPGLSNAWMRLRLVVADGIAAAKIWPDGAQEPPRWQARGPVEAAGVTGLAVGVWLPPTTPARATVFSMT